MAADDLWPAFYTGTPKPAADTFTAAEVFGALDVIGEPQEAAAYDWAERFGLPWRTWDFTFTFGQAAVILACHDRIEGEMRDRMVAHAKFDTWIGHEIAFLVFPFSGSAMVGARRDHPLARLCRDGAHVVDLDAVRARLAAANNASASAGSEHRDGTLPTPSVPVFPDSGEVA